MTHAIYVNGVYTYMSFIYTYVRYMHMEYGWHTNMQVRPEMTYGIYVIESFILMQIYDVWGVKPASKHLSTGGCMIRLVQAVHLCHPKHTTSCTVQGH